MTASHPRAPAVLLVEEGGSGGVSDYTCELAAALYAAGLRVHLATATDHRSALPAGVDVHRVFPYIRGHTPAGKAVRALRLARIFNGAGHLLATIRLLPIARRCDVVHMQGEEWPPLGVLEAALLKASGSPLLYTPHNTFSRSRQQWARSRSLIRRLASRVIVHSQYDLSSLGSTESKRTRVIPHGTYGDLASHGKPDISEAEARRLLGADDDEIVVLLFGQLRSDKGVRDLVCAMSDAPDVRVVLAGEDCGALEEVSDLLVDPHISRRLKILPGFADPEQTGRLFLACDVVALPYARASASGVLMLAYGYERPVIAYPVGGLPEYVVDGDTGWMCERPDHRSLAQTLAAVTRSGRAECRRRGQQAHETANDRFSWDTIANSTAMLYREAIDLRATAARQSRD